MKTILYRLTDTTRARIHASAPESVAYGLCAYLEHGRPPGSFLHAVLCNDLIGAFAHADLANRERMWDIAYTLYNYFPGRAGGAWGSSEAVNRYITNHASVRAGDIDPNDVAYIEV